MAGILQQMEEITKQSDKLGQLLNASPMDLLGKSEDFDCLDCEDTGLVHVGRHDNEEVKCHCKLWEN